MFRNLILKCLENFIVKVENEVLPKEDIKYKLKTNVRINIQF